MNAGMQLIGTHGDEEIEYLTSSKDEAEVTRLQPKTEVMKYERARPMTGKTYDKSLLSAALTSGSVGLDKFELQSRSSHMNAEKKKLTLVRETDGEYPV